MSSALATAVSRARQRPTPWRAIFIWTPRTWISFKGCAGSTTVWALQWCWGPPAASARFSTRRPTFRAVCCTACRGTLDGYFVSHQRERHLQLIRQRYGFSEFLDEGGTYFRLARWLYARCWGGEDRALLLFEQAVKWLLAHKVLLPGVTVLERFVGRVRDRAQRRLWRKLIEGLSAEQRRRIDSMFT